MLRALTGTYTVFLNFGGSFGCGGGGVNAQLTVSQRILINGKNLTLHDKFSKHFVSSLPFPRIVPAFNI